VVAMLAISSLRYGTARVITGFLAGRQQRFFRSDCATSA